MHDFKRLLLLCINTEVRVNNLKKSLSERKNFDPVKAYVACGGSEDGKSRLKVQDFQKFLLQHNFIPNDRQLGWLFERFDRFKNGEIDL